MRPLNLEPRTLRRVLTILPALKPLTESCHGRSNKKRTSKCSSRVLTVVLNNSVCTYRKLQLRAAKLYYKLYEENMFPSRICFVHVCVGSHVDKSQIVVSTDVFVITDRSLC